MFEEFSDAWHSLSDLNLRHGACLLSRLHRKDDKFYEYALWPDERSFKNASELLPPAALALQARLNSACNKSNELVGMEALAELRNTQLGKEFF